MLADNITGERNITYTVSVTVTRPVRVYEHGDSLEDMAAWMAGNDAKHELVKEILRALRVVDGECDAEVMDIEVEQ